MAERKETTPTIPAKAPVATLADLIRGPQMKAQFANALPKILPPDRFIRCLLTTIQRIPEIAQCDRNSVLACAMTAAQLGLEIDPTLGYAYLIPYKDKTKGKVAQLIVGYKGYISLAYRSGMLSGIQAEVVYEKDHFEYQFGLNPKLVHVPADTEDRGKLKYAHCVATFANGGNAWRVLNRTEIMRHKASSRAAGSEYSPWQSHEAEMWRKTAVRSLASMLPLSPEFRDAVALEEDEDTVTPPMVDLGNAILDTSAPAADAEGMAGAVETKAEEKK